MTFSLDNIVAWAKRRWFAYPGSDIYGWLANAWDLWPYGVEIKNNIENNRWKYFVQKREDIIWLDSQILMNPKVREASGHVWWFSDPLIDCKKCKSRLRADQLIENWINSFKKILSSKEKEDIKKEWNLNNEQDVLWSNLTWWLKVIEEANSQALNHLEKYWIKNLIPESRTFEQQKAVIDWEKIKCPKCWACDWTEPKQFNLMFKTEQWTIEW
jgi:glycyl-tRNA synthetase